MEDVVTMVKLAQGPLPVDVALITAGAELVMTIASLHMDVNRSGEHVVQG
jgi:hypothetical protein